ncbi:MAG: hypothetical protein QF492_01130 [Candidatus Krumholzibacteria bacterium]|jgi:hypothetical protein|nr:hypothetical protein [Candidatus Krumholzibacteria bacterium]MDP6668496.1 hypothetical protein [Candidatus Krumholzibacteria bacterium]MDP6797530.1 hypothetical protein [Candidatus Krumholzibacteria bacterium]MDP7021377.1 hypothetical protein [Candidatus Krumholzibacteria bacterium]
MSLLKNVSQLDRRWIFLVIALSVAIPLLFPFSMPIRISPHVETVYEALEELPDGSIILCSFEYGPSTMPEVHPMSRALLHYMMQKNHKVIVTCLWPDGLFMSRAILDEVCDQAYGKEYGVDYINLGYKAGNEVVIKSIVESFSTTYPVDTRGGSLSSYPIMKGIENLANIDFIFSFSAGYPGTIEWVQYAADPLDKPMSTGCTAVQVTEVVPFIQSGQCKGILGGLSGAAEFERLLMEKGHMEELGSGNRGMAAQSVAHIVMVLFIVIGNLAFFLERRRQR